jgi:hypothetical protein
VDIAALRARRAELDAFVASMAAHAPSVEPDKFPTPDEKLAFWLNAYHALVLEELLERWPLGSPDEVPLGRFAWARSWPIGGERLTLWSIERRFLRESGDARVFLARFTGHRGGPLLDGAPFDPATLDAQLNDAGRRFMRRKENVAIEGKTVKVSSVLRDHQEAFMAALPSGRVSVLQIVWAFLPETCESERPGCETRGELDKLCGATFDKCTVEFVAGDRAVAAK